MLATTAFAFDLGANTSAIYRRFLRFSVIPAPIVLAYVYKMHYYPKLAKWTIYIGAFVMFYMIVYAMYCAYLNGYQITYR